MLLNEIVANKRQEIGKLQGMNLRHFAQKVSPALDFLAAFPAGRISLIAEVKKASPSAGVLRDNFDPVAIAKEYEAAGAAAISVLTDEKYFQGRIEHLTKIKTNVPIPILCKDFIIDEAQIYEARIAGADAVLLIARILTDLELVKFLCLAHELGMQALLEVHNAAELERALNTKTRMIGINNRDLDTFKVDLGNTLKLIHDFPRLRERIIISESGIKTSQDVRRLKEAGVAGVLVGETLLRSRDIRAKIKELGL